MGKRLQARQLFAEALAELAPARLLEAQLRCDGRTLRLPDAVIELPSRLLILAFGKAANAMAHAWQRITPDYIGQVAGVLCSPDLAPDPEGWQTFRGGHPAPNIASQLAAQAMLRAARELQTPALVVYLISGGGSALVETPLDVSLANLQATYQALVGGGAPITAMNAIRKHLSAFKGGRLARAAQRDGIRQLSLILSDVPPGELDSVASGPTLPDRSTADDCYQLQEQWQFPLPPRVGQMFRERQLQETPKPGDPAFEHAHWHLLADNQQACNVLAQHAKKAGWEPVIDHAMDEAEVGEAALYLTDRLHELRRANPRACVIAGGEVRVKVTGASGQGGRNQQFALECVRYLRDDETVFSAGTDGVDGNSRATGAIADAGTEARARAAGKDIQASLQHFDAYPLFAALGDAIETGPTNNNLRDLRLLF